MKEIIFEKDEGYYIKIEKFDTEIGEFKTIFDGAPNTSKGDSVLEIPGFEAK